MTPTGWTPEDDLSMREWAGHGRRLGVIGRGAGWWIGDWLHYGNVRFGERYVRASRITGYDVQTLMNMVYVASRFEISRRRENLSFSHHAELAALDPADQDRWLERAEVERLSVRCLREEIRRERRRREAEAQVHMPVEEQPAIDPSNAIDAHQLVCPECGAHIKVDEPAAALA